MIFLGIIGIIPFLFGLLDLWLNKEFSFITINITKYYGVIILTFLGSKYWGIILNQNNIINFTNRFKVYMTIWSITPSILSIIVLLIDEKINLIILSISYLICQIVDEIYNKFLLFPKWYISFRRLLTFTFTVIIIIILCYLILYV